ncbi:MAG: sugar ABC transporter ATP-binding protein [Alicyclobacillus macrosporangiidus]|uniref:sugar ABC transporter ATP-binding protein n=1 Tax=Alicyclobacillus macrosporangiidus TaxID=392015 RepID=UPI0026F20D9D|nr:sugar ABC transporter ATP-binding protein [Alicyclobacillus macrosporangiidus]MCL6601058.1 sugar ABC transporter ATP-binding protein [Alicyclobacillus macrosporangiidus]
MSILEARKVSKSYGGVKALVETDFECQAGEIHALLGENGAGKSTLVKIFSGVVRPDEGTIWVDGRPVQLHSPDDARRLGIASVFQELSLIPNMSVAENLFLGREPKNRLGLIDFRQLRSMAKRLMERFGIDVAVDARVADLPMAQQQMVEIAKALAKEPRILILDEATSSLGPKEVDHLFELCRALKEQGKSVIFISHRMDEIDRIADRATVFRDAQRVRTFRVGEVTNQQVINWIAGREVVTDSRRQAGASTRGSNVVLEVEHLSAGKRLHDVNLRVHRGEVLGIAGLQGHGQSEFLLSLFGAYPVTGGSIKIGGRVVPLDGPKDAIRNGIVLVPENRKFGGLMLTRSIRENLALMTLDKRQRWGVIRRCVEDNVIEQLRESLAIKADSMEQTAGSLSGGNQQKIVIGKTLLTDFQVLLLADPTRGIDVGTKQEIYKLIAKLASEGKTVIFYSTELRELVVNCDRVAVFYEGTIKSILQGEEIDERRIAQEALALA